MGKSLKLGTISGIKIQVHWTFSLILVWVLINSLVAGKGLLGALTSLAFILALFGCVLLHELGHALAARMYGVPTKDITLLPIGGVARLERMPRKPSQELVVALAGPAVNVAIAGVLFLLLVSAVGLASLVGTPFQSATFLQQLMFLNVALVVFNLLPAFPMDGGRVLRATLATVMSYARATRVAAIVGQTLAVALGFLGLVNPMLLLIAGFIFLGAAAESNQVAIRERFEGFHVRDGMIRRFRAVDATAPLRDTVLDLLESPQRDFPVIDDGMLVGMLNIDQAVAALRNDESLSIAAVMSRDVRTINEDDPLTKTCDLAAGRSKTLPVTSNGALIGLLDFQRVFDLLKARSELKLGPSYTKAVASRAIPNFT